MGRHKTTAAPCAVEGCERPTSSKGLCATHYQAERRRKARVRRCPKCDEEADDLHISRCRRQPPIKAGDGDPRHGNLATYRHHGCRCAECVEANRAVKEVWRRKRGIMPIEYASPLPVRNHLKILRRSVPLYSVGKAAGKTYGSIQWIFRTKRMDAQLADKILGTTISDCIPHVEPMSFIRIERSKAVAQELREAGWSKMGIQKAIGYTGNNMSIFRPECQRIQARYAQALEKLHDQQWRDNTNNFRQICKCMATEPSTARNTENKRRSREAVARYRARQKEIA